MFKFDYIQIVKLILFVGNVLGSFGGKCMLQSDFESSKKSLSSMIQGFSYAFDIEVTPSPSSNDLYKKLLRAFGSNFLSIVPISFDKDKKLLCCNESAFANDYRSSPFDGHLNKNRIIEKQCNAELGKLENCVVYFNHH